MTDLGFMRELGEIIKSPRFRFISGVHEVLSKSTVLESITHTIDMLIA